MPKGRWAPEQENVVPSARRGHGGVRGTQCVRSRDVQSADTEQGCVLPVAAPVPALPSLCFRVIIIFTPPGGSVLEKVILTGTSSLWRNPEACDLGRQFTV